MLRKPILWFFLLLVSHALLAQPNLQVSGTTPSLYLVHKIQAKETWYAIGRLYNLSPKDIATYNNTEINKGLVSELSKSAKKDKLVNIAKEFAKKNLYVETELGRQRNIPEINSPNFQVQNAAERMAINMPIQGLAADIVKLAMIKVSEEYTNNPEVKMVLQIHDEIILEVKESEAKKVAEKVKEIMENVYKLKVPLVVDVKIGDNWGEI